MIKIIQNRILFLILILMIAGSSFARDLQQDSIVIKTNKKLSTKSPRKAMIYSLIFPGLGQLYNGKKLKALFFFSVESGLLINSVYLNQMYKKSADPYNEEFYINNRNLSTWWLVGSVLVSILDAYVDAQLYNFDESPDLSIYFDQPVKKPGIMLSFFISF